MLKKLVFVLLIVFLFTACSGPPSISPTIEPTVEHNETEQGSQTSEGNAPIEQGNEPNEAISESSDYKACLVTDTGGINDRMFNASAWQGITNAQERLGIEGKFLESKTQSDYEPNIKAFIEEGCDLIVAVGYLQADAVQKAATENPEQRFVIVDFTYETPMENVLGLIFKIDESAFLAGYIAAGMTNTGIIGTFGGLNIPAVTDYMNGLYYGIQYFNQENDSKIMLKGWDPSNPESGLFLGNFTSLEDSRAIGTNLIDEGADIIFPCAGPANFGAAAVVKGLDDVSLIGGDTDQYITAPEYSDFYLVSILKNIDVAVFDTIQSSINGSFEGGIYVGTLANSGVGLSPFYEFEDDVPDEVKARIEELKQDIIDGKIEIQK